MMLVVFAALTVAWLYRHRGNITYRLNPPRPGTLTEYAGLGVAVGAITSLAT